MQKTFPLPLVVSVAGLSRLRIGNTLQAVLREKGWSLQQLSEEIERDLVTLRRWCTDRVPLEIGTLVEVALILGVPLSRFLAGARA